MSPVGNEVSAVLFGVDSKLIENTPLLYKTLKSALKKERFHILGETDYKFKPHGYTLAFLLGESHVAIHTYPEFNSIAFQIYSCRGPEDGFLTFKYFVEKLKPKEVKMTDFRVVVDPRFKEKTK
jgi:S-adenosylmethionine decarboxylase